MRTGHVVGYTEAKDKFGTKYFKGEDGTIFLPNPRDQRPSRMIFVKKISFKNEQQQQLTDYKIPRIEIKEKFRVGQEIIYYPRRTKQKIRGTILKIYKTTFGSSLKDKALQIKLNKKRKGRTTTTIRAKNAKVKR